MKPPPIRKRMKRREIPHGIRFITFSCYHQLALMGHRLIRELFVRALYAARARYGFELFAWVVMPEHAHVLMRPRPGVPMRRILQTIKQSVAERTIARWRELDAAILHRITLPHGVRFWQRGGGFDRNVRDLGEFTREVRYIHRNPVERELVARPQGWAWSSVRWWMGMRENERPCDPPPGDPRSWAAWKGFM